MEGEYSKEKDMLGEDPLNHVRRMVLEQASDITRIFNELEERIAVVGKELDLLSKARDTASDVLRNTEALRSEINEELGNPMTTPEPASTTFNMSEHPDRRHR
jgi:hypothetical protein